MSAACGDPLETPQASPSPWLREVTQTSGVDFVHEPGARGEFRLPEIMGGGVGLFDADGDGDLDLYLTNGRPFVDEGGPAPRNRLFLQQAPWLFADATEQSGLGDTGYGMGIAVGDVDDDGDADVYVTNLGADRLYLNRGDGRFDDATAAAGIEVDGWSSSAVFLDYDADGWLDLFVTRYVRDDPTKRCTDATGRPDYCTPAVHAAEPDVLLHNRGDGTFEDVTARAGLLGAVGPGLGVAAEDFNGDGLPDLFVANDGAANHLWLNRGDGSFEERALALGVAYNLEGRAEAGMGVVAADLDGDADADLLLTHLSGESHTLYRNRGAAGGFDDVTGTARLATASMGDTGFGAAALDLELDGDLDLAVVNGRVTRGRAREGLAPPWNEFAEANGIFLNDGDGRFTPAGQELREFGAPLEISRGLALGDVDGDGDVDLVVANLAAGPRLFRNDSPRRGRWLSVEAVDPRRGRTAIGARVVLAAGERRDVRTIGRGGSYLSSSEPRAHFALVGDGPWRLDVRWPDGTGESFPVKGADRLQRLVRGAGRSGP